MVGDYVLNQNDIENHVVYPDATGSLTWNLDLHWPDPIHAEKFDEPFRSCAYHRNLVEPYPVAVVINTKATTSRTPDTLGSIPIVANNWMIPA